MMRKALGVSLAASLAFGAGSGSSIGLCLQPGVLLLAGSWELGAGLGSTTLCLRPSHIHTYK